MKILLIIVSIYLFFYICGKISDFLYGKRLVKEFEPKVDDLIDEVKPIYQNAPTLKEELAMLQVKLQENIAVLKDDKGNILNICPKCGDTLAVRDTIHYERIFGCPNYPKCRHLIKVSDLDFDSFDSIEVK